MGKPKKPCMNFILAAAEPSEELILTRKDIFFDGFGRLHFVDRSIVAVRRRSCVDLTHVRKLARAKRSQTGMAQELLASRAGVRAAEISKLAKKCSFSKTDIKLIKKVTKAEAQAGTAPEESVISMEPFYAPPPGSSTSSSTGGTSSDSTGDENEVPPVSICPCDVTVESG